MVLQTKNVLKFKYQQYKCRIIAVMRYEKLEKKAGKTMIISYDNNKITCIITSVDHNN